ncbi:MAG: alcohol dehydrogenase catalytic domain-containing protein, partial [Anaerolineae bacterium]
MNVKAYAAETAAGALKPFEYTLGEIGAEEVDLAVDYCGICHSDLSMLDNDWQITRYPFVPGHEIVGRIEAVGPAVRH